ncbi:MAG: hypothetical protein CMO01_31135 [Thalassobius sp.]|nr:hypothetical protein [Thalassovita sp.]
MMETNRKGIGGRKRVDASQKLEYPAKTYLTKKEYDAVFSDFEQSGMKKFAAYLRKRLVNPKKKINVVNPVELLRKLDTIGGEINRVGNNINQIAKHGNSMVKNDQLKPEVVEDFNQVMAEYLKTRNELISTLRSVIRKV